MPASDKLAVLIPVYNGGDTLRQTVASCAAAGLNPDEYEIIVVDNASTDDAVARLPFRDGAGASINIFQNESNIGRVPNWNRAIELAADLGFRYITFLFAGDTWQAGEGVRTLFNAVRDSGAQIGFAPFIVTDEAGAPKYESRRFYVSGDASTVCTARQFAVTMLESGMFPLGPIQANIYRLYDAASLWFDPAIPTRADVEATLDFVLRCEGPVAITSAPFLQWREHAGRFHATMGPARTIEDYMETFRRASDHTALQANRSRGKSRVVLNSLRLMWKEAPPSQWPHLLGVIARVSRSTPYRMTPAHFLETLWSRFAMRRRLLQFE